MSGKRAKQDLEISRSVLRAPGDLVGVLEAFWDCLAAVLGRLDAVLGRFGSRFGDVWRRSLAVFGRSETSRRFFV